MTLELAQSCSGYVTTIINNTDVVPTISPGIPSRQVNHALVLLRWKPSKRFNAENFQSGVLLCLFVC